MKIPSELILKGVRLFAWIIFVWMLVKAGGIIMGYGASFNNPEGATDLYRGLDLSRYANASFLHYSIIVLYLIFFSLLQAYFALFVTRLLSVANLENSNTKTVSSILEKMKSIAIMIVIVSIIHNIHVEVLARFAEIEANSIAWSHIFAVAVVYVLTLGYKQSIDQKITDQ